MSDEIATTMNSLRSAIKSGKCDVVSNLIETANTNNNLDSLLLGQDAIKQTILHYTFQYGSIDLIKSITSHYSPATLRSALEVKSIGSNTPLSLLMKRTDAVSVFEALLQTCSDEQFEQILSAQNLYSQGLITLSHRSSANKDAFMKVISAEVAARGKGDLLTSQLNATDGFGRTAAEWLGDTAAIKLEQMSKPIAQNAQNTTAGFFSASAATLATAPEKREIDSSIAYKAGAMHKEYDKPNKLGGRGHPQNLAAAIIAFDIVKVAIASQEGNIKVYIGTLEANPLTTANGNVLANAQMVNTVKAAATELLDNGPNAVQALAAILAATAPVNGGGGSAVVIQAVDTALQGLQTSAKALANARANLLVAKQYVAHYQEPSKMADQIGILSSRYSDDVLWATKKGLEEAKTHLTPDSILYNISDAGIGFIDNYGPWFNPVTQVCVAGVQLYSDPKHAVTHGFDFFARSGLLSGTITPAVSKLLDETVNADPDDDYSKEIQSGIDASLSLLSSAAIASRGGSFSSRPWNTMPMHMKMVNAIKLLWDAGKFIMIPLQTFSNYVLSSPEPNAYMSDETALAAKRTSEGFLKGGQTIYTFSAFGLWGKLLPLMGEAIGVARDSDLTPNGKQIALSVASRVPVATMLVNNAHDNGQIRAFYNSKLTEAYNIFQNVFLAMHCTDASSTSAEWKAVADIASGIREGLKSTTRSYNGYVEVKSIELMHRDKSSSYSDVERAYAAFTSGGDDLGLKNNGFKEVRAAWHDIINELQKPAYAAKIEALKDESISEALALADQGVCLANTTTTNKESTLGEQFNSSLKPSPADVNVNRIFPATITKEQAKRYFAEKAANPSAGVASWITKAGIKGVFDNGGAAKDPVCGVYGHHSISELMIRLISEGYQVEAAQRNKIDELSTECLQSHLANACTKLGTEFAKIVVYGETPFHADHSSST